MGTSLAEGPQYASAQIFGRVAVSLAGGATWKSGTPGLWIDGEPFGFLVRAADSIYGWVRRASEGELPWATVDGTSLRSVAAMWREPRGYLSVALDDAPSGRP